MAERTHYTVERSKAPMPEWEVLGTHQTFRQALAAAASWQKDTKAPLRVVRVTREVMDTAPGVAMPPQAEPIGWEWRWFDSSPYTVTSDKWTAWERVKPRNSLQTEAEAVQEFRDSIAAGYRYELRQLFAVPHGVAIPQTPKEQR